MNKLRAALEQRRGRVNGLRQQIADEQAKQKILQQQLDVYKEARSIVQVVAQATQQELEYHITEVTNLAMASVFDDPYKLIVKFEPKRGGTEAKLLYERNGQTFEPIKDTGGGADDIGAFALRVSMWLMKNPRSRNTLILDEPFPTLKGKTANLRALEMAHKISHELNLQVIMISDERAPLNDIAAMSDKLFSVQLNGGVSHVETVSIT